MAPRRCSQVGGQRGGEQGREGESLDKLMVPNQGQLCPWDISQCLETFWVAKIGGTESIATE